MAISTYPNSGATYTYDLITTSGTWVRPSGVSRVDVFVASAGGGGGAGAQNATTTQQVNGGAGGGAGLFQAVYGLDVENVGTVSVTIGAGGIGGIGGSGKGTNGTSGGVSVFGNYVGTSNNTAYYGRGGSAGEISGTTGPDNNPVTTGVTASIGTWASTSSISQPYNSGSLTSFSMAQGPNSIIMNQTNTGGGGASYSNPLGWSTNTYPTFPFPYFPRSLVTAWSGTSGTNGTGTSPGNGGTSLAGFNGGGGFGGRVDSGNSPVSGSQGAGGGGGGGGGGRTNGGNGGNAYANSGSGGGGGGGGRSQGGNGGNGAAGFVIVGYFRNS